MFHCLHACRLLLFMFSIFLVSCEKKKEKKRKGFQLSWKLFGACRKEKKGKLKFVPPLVWFRPCT